ncbi:YciI family protein [Ulvibacterium marinum]|uniref:YciI family protein n=1 Tax=Ulvibacterium marinum TaxID=2419782 RepID=UPI00249429E2|nr:YciI family protein [Ulvibacterium marinum]
MQEFLLLIHGSGYKDESPKMLKKHMERYINWMDSLVKQEKFVKGHRLDDSGHYLMDKDTVISDGPFLEPKEIIGGYIIIKAENLENATKIAQQCPLIDEFQISIRPMYKGPNEHEFPK